MAKSTRPEEQETPNIRLEDMNEEILTGGENFPGAGEEVKADPNEPIVVDPTGSQVGGSTGRGATDGGKSDASGTPGGGTAGSAGG